MKMNIDDEILSGFFKNLIKKIDSHQFSHEEVLTYFKEFVQSDSKLSKAWKRKIINSFNSSFNSNGMNKNNIVELKNPSLIFTKMRSPYLAKLGYEFLQYQVLSDPYHVRRAYASSALPVILQSCSPRLETQRIMALFPENWDPEYRSNVEKMPVYYFINRFFDRFVNLTRPILELEGHRDFFSHVIHASEKEIVEAAVIWVSLHEYFHATGALPLPSCLKYKRTKESGAFEELRVDLNVISEIPQLKKISPKMLQITREYVLGERLVHYASNYLPGKDYDAISSQMFLNSLMSKNAVRIEAGAFRFSASIWDAVFELRDEFNKIEKENSVRSPDEAVQSFSSVTKQYGNYNISQESYDWLPIYQSFYQLLSAADRGIAA